VTKLRIGDRFGLPDDVLTDVTAILGRRGRGKTTTGVVLVEEAWAAKRRFVVLDPVGVWWGLGRLRSLGFIDYPSTGLVAAQPVLFLGA
jgi:hypothetical protein